MEAEERATFAIGELRLDRAKGIIKVSFVPGAEQTLDTARDELAAIKRLGGGERALLLVNMNNLKSVTREARALFATPEFGEIACAVALVSRSAVGTMIANVYYATFGTDRMPTKLFASETDATAWLEEIRKTARR